MENAVSKFKQKLNQLDRGYVLLSSVPSAIIHFKFLGKFEGREVIWDTQLIALKHNSNQQIAKSPIAKKSYLEIEPILEISKLDSELKLTVGLPVKQITIPVIRKTVIMIQNYKRLKCGRHDFGGE